MPFNRIVGRTALVATTNNSSGSANFDDAYGSLEIISAETNNLPTHSELFEIAILSQETNNLPTKTHTFEIKDNNADETNTVPDETRSFAIRCWASNSTDNDSSNTNPTRANGQNDNVRAGVSTNLALADLTNPVILTSTTFNVPGTGTFSSKLIRVFFNIPARTLQLDTIQLLYNVGAGDVAFYTHSGGAAFNSDGGSFTFDISALTLAQLATISLKASYQAAVVALPETIINLDAWCIEVVTTL